ncbi:hypothetical protein M2226_009639 [Bradyrhizobium elkanii]|nr:hypothetical protein [Bradyrhizobium elkanii]MCW2175996.1 hypothetical protein [Bradyrhizobium elkanii]
MASKPDDLPSDLASALAALQAEREARLRAEAMAASAQAELSDSEALVAHLELRIEKLKRELYGQRSERTARLLEQLELELEDLVAAASEDELAAQAAAAKTQCHLVLAFLTLETSQMAGPLRSTGVTPLRRYYGPGRHLHTFGRLPGVTGYTTHLLPAISPRGEEGFSSCLACPCHRAVAFTPPK